jgi:hypothetical protein
MGDEPGLMPHDRLIDELHALCVAGRSGTMFIITGENHAAQFLLRNGEIVYLTYRLLRGLDALPSMRIFTAGRYRFQDEPVDRTDPGLPPTPDLLALLSPEHTGTVEPPQTEPTTGTAKAPDSLRLLIERELAEFLGPMASLICAEHLAQATDLDSPKSLARLVEAIANEIGDPTKEAHFKQQVLSSLSGNAGRPTSLA